MQHPQCLWNLKPPPFCTRTLLAEVLEAPGHDGGQTRCQACDRDVWSIAWHLLWFGVGGLGISSILGVGSGFERRLLNCKHRL